MTENKRFRVFKYPDCKEYGVSDDIAEYTLARFDNYFEAEGLCELLNGLHEENQMLKMQYDAQRQLYCQLNSDKNNIWQDYQDLKKENEQLKKENKELQGKYDKQLHQYNGLGCEYDWLKEENEQLKSTIDEMIKIFQDSGLDYVVSDEVEEILE